MRLTLIKLLKMLKLKIDRKAKIFDTYEQEKKRTKIEILFPKIEKKSRKMIK